MKKVFSAMSLSLLSLSISASEVKDWYIGTQFSAQEVESVPDREFDTVGLMAGYQYNQYFSIETRLNKGTSGYSSIMYVNGLHDQKYKEDIDYQASLFIRASFPVYEAVNVYALAGVTKSKYEITSSATSVDKDGNVTTTYPYIIKLSESGFSYGVGVEYQINNSFNVFVDYKKLPDLDVASQMSNWKSVSLGLNYSF